jgi:plastocyanin
MVIIKIFCVLCILALNFSIPVQAETQSMQDEHHHHNMTLDSSGLVMNSNDNTLPQDCDKLSRDYNIKVYAGTKYAADYPGTVFGMDQHEYQVEPCSRITVTFVNEDEVRHQWMIHGLPRYLYPGGMFHLEAAGGHSQTGTFIVPSDNKTYLVHCDMSQHMEKGMKAQLKVGKGSGDLWAIPGVSKGFIQDIYIPEEIWIYLMMVSIAGVVITTLLISSKRS